MDYLFSEIFTNLPEFRQEWLLKIAILDRFCGQLCVALCRGDEGEEDEATGQSFIEWLQAANLFLVPLDDQGVWFRFHHLFLHLLRHRQQARYDGDTLSELARTLPLPGSPLKAWWRRHWRKPWPPARLCKR